MKKLVMILACLTLSYFSMAQEKVKQKEAGLVFSDLDNFGLTYRVGTNKSMWRFSTLFFDGYTSDNMRDTISNSSGGAGIGFSVGKEYRKIIADKLELRLGGDVSFSYRKTSREYHDSKTVDRYYTPGVYFVFGFNYIVKENLIFGVELLPSVKYSSATSVKKSTTEGIDDYTTTQKSLSYGFSNNSVQLSVAYRF